MRPEIADCYSHINSTMLVGGSIAGRYDLRMAGIRSIRRANLHLLLKRFKTQREFAEAADLVPAHVSQMNRGRREAGEDVARRIEKRLSLPVGWMDQPHDSSGAALTPLLAEVDLDCLERAIEEVERWLTTYRGRAPTATQKAAAILKAYEFFSQHKKSTDKQVSKLLGSLLEAPKR